MADNRLELHEKLCEVLKSRNVYFQPPESIKMTYPCVVYSLHGIDTKKADNKIYGYKKCYTIIYITPDSGDTLYDDFVKRFELSRFENYYRANGLNHYTITLYY